jgi:hypothetical protein
MRLKASRGETVSVGNEDLTRLQEAWRVVDDKLKLWQRRLDNNLPGRLGTIASWLDAFEDLVDLNGESQPRDPAKRLQQLRVSLSCGHCDGRAIEHL